jgi:hypothetical protein|tara:strand:- start:103 stop:258 length:156 start_codon:yes stop_codon:yes gene_type:complete
VSKEKPPWKIIDKNQKHLSVEKDLFSSKEKNSQVKIQKIIINCYEKKIYKN